MCDRARRTSVRRRGIASLEMVLSMPFLLLCAAVIFLYARASIAASYAAIQARHDAWAAGRRDHSARPFELGMDTDVDLVVADAHRHFRTSSALRFSSHEAYSRNAVLGGPWDHSDAPFRDSGDPLVPHTQTLTQLAQGALSTKLPTNVLDDVSAEDYVGLVNPGVADAVTDAGTWVDRAASITNAFSSLGSPGGNPNVTSSVPDPNGNTVSAANRQMARANDKKTAGGGSGSATSGNDQAEQYQSLSTLQKGMNLSSAAAGIPNTALQGAKLVFATIGTALDPLQSAMSIATNGLVRGVNSLIGAITKKSPLSDRQIDKVSQISDKLSSFGTSCFTNLAKAADGKDGDWTSLSLDDLKSLKDEQN